MRAHLHRPSLLCRPEYSTWAGMIVTHYGRLGPSDDAAAPSDSPYAHFSQTRALQQLRGFSSTGPSRSQSPQYGSGGARRRRLCCRLGAAHHPQDGSREGGSRGPLCRAWAAAALHSSWHPCPAARPLQAGRTQIGTTSLPAAAATGAPPPDSRSRWS